MNLFEFKEVLSSIEDVVFILPNGVNVPPYFHITEVGAITRHFIDCGGKVRKHVSINFQLYTSTDFDHRLKPSKLAEIIKASEISLALPNAEIEVEYQGQTVEKYGLDFNQGHFLLIPLKTDCLAKDACGLPVPANVEVSLAVSSSSCCAPGSSCC